MLHIWFKRKYLQLNWFLIKVLHLIGYGLQEQESGFYPFLTFHDHAAKWGILQLIEELVSSVRVNISNYIV